MPHKTPPAAAPPPPAQPQPPQQSAAALHQHWQATREKLAADWKLGADLLKEISDLSIHGEIPALLGFFKLLKAGGDTCADYPLNWVGGIVMDLLRDAYWEGPEAVNSKPPEELIETIRLKTQHLRSDIQDALQAIALHPRIVAELQAEKEKTTCHN